MHPIEHLRFVARAKGVDDCLLAVEATAGLVAFADDQPALVAACRRVLARQPACGRLWWACARLLNSADVWATAQETIAMIEGDPTEAALTYAIGGLDDAPGVDRAAALGCGRVLLDRGSSGPVRCVGGSGPARRWLVAPVGTHLADPMWGALTAALEVHVEVTFADLDGYTHVVGPHGPVPTSALGAPECAVAPELFILRG